MPNFKCTDSPTSGMILSDRYIGNYSEGFLPNLWSPLSSGSTITLVQE